MGSHLVSVTLSYLGLNFPLSKMGEGGLRAGAFSVLELRGEVGG